MIKGADYSQQHQQQQQQQRMMNSQAMPFSAARSLGTQQVALGVNG